MKSKGGRAMEEEYEVHMWKIVHALDSHYLQYLLFYKVGNMN